MNILVQKILIICFIFSLASCSQYSKIPYFKDLDHTKISNSVISNYSLVKIKSGDLLAINVTGNKESVAPFIPVENNAANPVYGYRVNQAGEIKLPVIGIVKATGLTTEELKAKLLTMVLPYVGANGDVEVRLLNFKIYVTGDVARPNEYSIQNEHINILEAITLAGDLNITARRDNIVLIREENGTRHYYPINLATKKVTELPYYYLQNNDIIYVTPDQAKSDQADSKGYRTATLALSALSVLSLFVSVLFVNRK